MLFQLIFSVHIAMAVITVGLIGYALYMLVRKYESLYMTVAVALAGVAVVEVATGVTVAVLSPTISVLSLMPHIGMYLGVCLFAEALIFVKKWAFRY